MATHYKVSHEIYFYYGDVDGEMCWMEYCYERNEWDLVDNQNENELVCLKE